MSGRYVADPCTQEAVDEGCTCRLGRVWSNDIDPPEPVIDEWCPLHGWRDPDRELEEARDDAATASNIGENDDR